MYSSGYHSQPNLPTYSSLMEFPKKVILKFSVSFWNGQLPLEATADFCQKINREGVFSNTHTYIHTYIHKHNTYIYINSHTHTHYRRGYLPAKQHEGSKLSVRCAGVEYVIHAVGVWRDPLSHAARNAVAGGVRTHQLVAAVASARCLKQSSIRIDSLKPIVYYSSGCLLTDTAVSRA